MYAEHAMTDYSLMSSTSTQTDPDLEFPEPVYTIPVTESQLEAAAEPERAKPVAVLPAPAWKLALRSVYRWLFTTIVILNCIGMIVFFLLASRPYPRQHLATAVTANLAIAILARQDYFFNSLYKVARAVPHWVPIRIRYILVRVYEYGGIHSGSSICALIWFLLFTAFLTDDFRSGIDRDAFGSAALALNYLVLVMLLGIIITAYPSVRFVHHNTFEFVHRFGGWTVLGIFWIELILYTKSASTGENLGQSLIKSPSFWLLLIISVHIFLPWLRLKKIKCDPEVLSDHALRLHHNIKMPLYRGLAISEHPLSEWHSFASIPDRDGKGGSLLISNAGDWTRKTIDNPKQHYYVKGIPRTGVLALVKMFKSAVIVTTGSGIGPVLGIAMDVPSTKVRLLWSTRSPVKTYGDGVIDLLKLVDTKAVIIDTNQHKGRPDLVGIAQGLASEINAEAVFVISNRNLTLKIINGLRDRGLHAYGPNWDS